MNDKGVWGEEQAAGYLKKHGYKILARNFHTRFGEIDMIAANRQYLVFVEVKTRKDTFFSLACEAVTPSKQNKIRITAEQWLSVNETALQPRFDVIEVYGAQGRLDSIRHIENAF